MTANAGAPALLAYLAPLSLILVAIVAHYVLASRPRVLVRWAWRAAVFSFGVAVAATGTVLVWGALVSPLIGVGDFGLSLRLDAVSAVMMLLVSSIGMLVIHFSRNYLDGDARQGQFVGALSLTVGAVMLLVTAGNLFHLVAAWIGTSLALHRLLVFYSERRGAVIAARKKFIVARISDVCLAVAALLLARAFGVTDLGALAEAAKTTTAAGAVPAGVGAATILIAVAAALKSAMFPFHGWLLEVMETPTPVSALLHAGLLNAGTFLVVRLGDVMFLSPAALTVLIVVGGFTAIFASVAMIMQNNVKVSLAYSSAAHMGFMLMLCGFGAHSVAIMHLVAHSYYKAHAFLSSGSIVDYIRELGSKDLDGAARPLGMVGATIAAAVIFIALATVLGIDPLKHPGETALGVIFVMAMTQLIAKSTVGKPRWYVIGRTLLAAGAVTMAFFALELSAAWLLSGAVAAAPEPSFVTQTAMVLAVLAFVVVTLLQTMLPVLVNTNWGRVAYVHLKNGLYANAMFDRLIGALR
ncbi:MAG: proton-conducting transporter membrane subunit [Caldilineaceae bacterium]